MYVTQKCINTCHAMPNTEGLNLKLKTDFRKHVIYDDSE